VIGQQPIIAVTSPIRSARRTVIGSILLVIGELPISN